MLNRYRTDRAQLIASMVQMLWGWRSDSAPSLFLQRELQDIEKKIYETPFAPLKADQLIPVKTIARGAQEAGYDRITHYGMARWLAASAKDLPSVNAERRRFLYPVKSLGAQYEYTQDDIDAAQMAGMPLDDTLARAARRAIDTFRNSVALEGDAAIGMTGFVNDPSVPSGNATTGNWLGGATPDQILADLNQMPIDVRTQTKEVYEADTLALPTSLHGYVATTPRSANSDTTILEYFLKANPQIKEVVPMLELEEAGAGGTGRAICYKKDLEILEQAVAIPFEQMPPQFSGLKVEVPCRGRIGGTHFKAPIACVYRDGL